MSKELMNDDGTNSTNANAMRQWARIKAAAALAVVCGILVGFAGTVIAMMKSFRIAAEGAQPIPVDSLAASVGSSLRFGMWLAPVVICFALLWIVARAKLRALSRTLSFSARNAG